jgi:uncharacterized caspase-like protein
MPGNYALIIGIDHYVRNQDGLRTLAGAIRDSNLFYDWVTDPAGGNVPETNVKLVQSTADPVFPNIDWIDEQIEDIFKMVVPMADGADRLYFYFAGHGLSDKSDPDNNALCASNWTSRLATRAMSTSGHMKLFNITGLFREVIYVTDCCRNAKWYARPVESAVTPELYQGPYAGAVSFFKAFATQYNDESYEVMSEGGETEGIFTRVLVRGLRGEAVENGTLDGAALRKYLLMETVEEAVAHGLSQEPVVFNQPHGAEPILFSVSMAPGMEEELVECIITFSAARAGPVTLEDSLSTVIATYDPAVNNQVAVMLKKQMHLLTEVHTQADKSIKIKPNQGGPIHVTF